MSLDNLNISQLFDLGRKLFDEKKHDQEVTVWKKALLLEPEDILVKSNLASALGNTGHLTESLELFDEILSKNPFVSRALHNRALLLIRIGYSGEDFFGDLLVSLITSENEDIYYRHFFNMCMAVSSSRLRDRNEFLDVFERIAKEPPLASNRSFDKSQLKSNINSILSAFLEVFDFFDAITDKRWGSAQTKLIETDKKFKALTFPPYAAVIGNFYCRFYQVLETAVNAFQKFGSIESSIIDDQKIIEEAMAVLRQFPSSSIDKFSFRLASLFGNLFFLFEMCHKLKAFSENLEDNLKKVRNDLDLLLEGHSSTLGRMINSISDFAMLQIQDFNKTLERNIVKAEIEKNRQLLWSRIKIIIAGHEFNFSNLTEEASRALMGWKSDDFTKLHEDISGFIYYIERQASKDIFQNNKPQENIARALLQAYLKSRSYREVPVGSGRSDVIMFFESGRALIETKIWRGKAYFDQGVKEIYEYFEHENSDGNLKQVNYLVFDPTEKFASKCYLGEKEKVLKHKSMQLNVFLIHIKQPYPSKKQ